ncbi:diacylglycerol kinase [Atopococcus tabaci]|uniref:diacylglycerol kinase n=1 Tax=Atopococcus tabaci TaxID=269774 RepID=UPI0003FB00D3|nr:diacylglycerol kinase [Atopococcus tabaci]
MNKRARIIYNPVSGREMIKRQIPDILQVYEEAGYETSTFSTTPTPFSAQKEAERAAKAGFDLIVAAGGDGTINEVVNGIAGLEKRPQMAILPAGTTNDYARALHIPRNDLVEAAKVIHRNQFAKMDIGKLRTGEEERFFVNIGAAGYLTELTYEVPAQQKAIFGNLAYFVKGAEMLPRIRPVSVRIEYDTGIYEGKASMFFVALTNSVGGFEKIAPDKMPGDGKFTLIIVKPTNFAELLRLITLLMNNGKHVNSPNIIYTKTSAIKAQTMDGSKMMINIDGEYGGDAPAEFINLQQHIDMIANTDNMAANIDPRDDDAEEREEAFIRQVEELEKNQQNTNNEE